MIKDFEMTEKQLDTLLKACKPVRYMIVGGIAPATSEENANTAWNALGEEMGFVGKTVKLIDGKGQRFFTAEVK